MQGAFGHITCVDLETGETIWAVDLAGKFGVEVPTWGFCGSPLIVGKNLIAQTPAPAASLVALNIESGEVSWKTSGEGCGYSSLARANIGNQEIVAGYESRLFVAWDAKTGKRLWSIKPENEGDFNVPTAIFEGNHLWLISENNGLRKHDFNDGKPIQKPAAQNDDLIPDSHSPVMVKDRIFVVHDGLHCVDAKSLKNIWSSEDNAYNVYGSIIASENRLLVVTFSGSVILVDATSKDYQPISHWKLIDDGTELYAHPAIAGTKLFIRLGKRITCIELKN